MPCELFPSVLSPDPSTLFTTSGMQKNRLLYKDYNFKRTTFCDIQRCLRLNDLEEIGDGTHFLDFHMLGLFSFRHWSLNQGIQFWLSFLDSIQVLPDTVTIHPECQHHRYLYKDIDVIIKEDSTCTWTDGDIGGYCTEFYKDNVEIGNIVVPLGENLDCGFGLERICSFIPNYNNTTPTKENVLIQTIQLLIEENIKPSPNKHGYILRKLIRTGLREQITLPPHPIIEKEKEMREIMLQKIPTLLKKYPQKHIHFFKDTFGIDEEEILKYQQET